MSILCWIIVAIIVFKLILKLTNGICKSNVCLVGKTVLITGGNSGIGYYTALGLAARGARVIIASRTCDEKTKQEIIKHTHNPNIVVKYLDLGSLESVRKFAKEIHDTETKIDILINNAGLAGHGNAFTEDGLHKVMAINHFGPFLLTHLLIDLLKKAAPAKLLFLSSLAAYDGKIETIEEINNPYGTKESTTKFRMDSRVYANTKLCNVIAANYFAEKLKGFGITSNSLHPGAVDTQFLDKLTGFYVPKSVASIIRYFFLFFMKDSYEGAQTTLRLALSNKLKDVTGKFYLDSIQFFMPKKAKDQNLCDKVIRESERLIKLTPEEKL